MPCMRCEYDTRRLSHFVVIDSSYVNRNECSRSVLVTLLMSVVLTNLRSRINLCGGRRACACYFNGTDKKCNSTRIYKLPKKKQK
jgi:hypothetical protein